MVLDNLVTSADFGTADFAEWKQLNAPNINLAQDVPTRIAALSDNGSEVWATQLANGGFVEIRPLPGSVIYNQQAMLANVDAALTRLRQIKTQAAAFQGQSPYVAANLTNLNDLLAKNQTMAGAVSDIANDLIQLVRLLRSKYDGTS